MKVLIACEESQEVCKAFRARGHEAYSCDIQEPGGGHLGLRRHRKDTHEPTVLRGILPGGVHWLPYGIQDLAHGICPLSRDQSSVDSWRSGVDVFHWWMEDGVLPGQETMEGFEENI